MTENQVKSESQLETLKQAFRELECDDDPMRFRKRVGKLAAVKPIEEKPANSWRASWYHGIQIFVIKIALLAFVARLMGLRIKIGGEPFGA